mgnify:CR=1 FL=1
MKYKIIYSNSLSHHGILGQKWGVRRYQNPDGTWTAEGKKRYGKAMQDASHDMLKSDKYKKAVSDMDKAYKEVNDYYKLSEKERDKYYEQAARNAHKQYGDDPEDEEEYQRFFRAYKYDDLDQGYDSSFSYYLKDKGIDPKKWSEREYNANKKFANEVKSAVNDSLKKLGNEEYSAIKADAKQYERIVDQIVHDTKWGEGGSRGYWYNLLEL